MKTIFEKSARAELFGRINKLNEESSSVWGKMNVYQMLKHCTMWDEWILGINNTRYKRVLIGHLFGKAALKTLTADASPLRRNTPTLAAFKVQEKYGDIELEKSKWIELIDRYDKYSNPGFVHSFFGEMTKEQVGILAYKHADHHLRQFNC